MFRVPVLGLVIFGGSISVTGEENCYYWQFEGGGIKYTECYPNLLQPVDVACSGFCSNVPMTNEFECDGPTTHHEYDTTSEWEVHDANVEEGYREAISWEVFCHKTAECECTEPMFQGQPSNCVTNLNTYDEGTPTIVRELDINSPCPDDPE
jgi:hypothetical protein